MAALTGGLRLITALLTVIPVGELAPTTPRSARAGMLLAPLPRLLLGLVAGLIGWGLVRLGAPPLAGGVAAVGTIALGNRGMHLDGLSDTVDGLGAGWSRERALEIMKKGDVGPMGVVALIVVVGLQASCWAALATLPKGWLLIAALVMVSGWGCAVSTVRSIGPARPGGLGAAVAGVLPVWAAAASWLVLTGLLVLAAVAAGLVWWSAVVAAGLMAVAVIVLLVRTTRVFGGGTGDVIGASIEVALTAASLGILLG